MNAGNHPDNLAGGRRAGGPHGDQLPDLAQVGELLRPGDRAGAERDQSWPGQHLTGGSTGTWRLTC